MMITDSVPTCTPTPLKGVHVMRFYQKYVNTCTPYSQIVAVSYNKNYKQIHKFV